MPARIRPGFIGVLAVAGGFLTGTAYSAPADVPARPRAALPTDPDALKSLAEAAEKKGQWEKALEFYLRAFVAGRQSPEIRDKIKDCLRNAAQTRRHRDPGFQQFVLNLPPADALNLYAEVVAKLQTTYADRDRSTPERLFELGLEELDRALADAGFRTRHLVGATEAKVAKFRRTLQTDWKQRLPKTAREARQAAYSLIEAAQRDPGLRNPAAVVLELLCGACGG